MVTLSHGSLLAVCITSVPVAGVARLVPAPREGGAGPAGHHGPLPQSAGRHLLQELLQPDLLGGEEADGGRVGAGGRAPVSAGGRGKGNTWGL